MRRLSSSLLPFAVHLSGCLAGSPKNKLRNQQYGFSTGGPIIRDRTFFFVTYEEQKFLIGNQAQSTEPSLSYQQAANQMLQFYGLAENPVSATLLGTIWPGDALTGPATANSPPSSDARPAHQKRRLAAAPAAAPAAQAQKEWPISHAYVP